MNNNYNFRRTCLAAGIATALTIGINPSLQAEPLAYTLAIKSQKAGPALMALGERAGVQIIVPHDIGNSVELPKLEGKYTLNEALDALLRKSGLRYEFAADNVVVIKRANEKQSNRKVSDTLLDEIIVTAEKREQNLQDVPAAISAFTEEMLEARGIATPQDLQFSVPGLSIDAGGLRRSRVTIRGIGTEGGVSVGGDPGVPIHINGHYTQSTAYILRDLLDVERVEVQRGPQGTLYGRNAVGGNINIITKRPTDAFEAQVGIDVGNYNKRLMQAVVSGPFSDRLRGRFALSDNERDGYVENVGNNGGDRNTSDYTSIRGALEFDLTDSVQMYFSAFYYNDEGNTIVINLNEDIDNISNTNPFKVATNTPDEQKDTSKGASLDVSWDFESVTFRSLSAFDETSSQGISDIDIFSKNTFRSEFGLISEYQTYTQEFQLLSTHVGAAQWVVGAFYYREDSSSQQDIPTDGGLIQNSTRDTNGDGVVDLNDDRVIIERDVFAKSRSKAIYGQVDHSMTDNLQLIAGLRYSYDEKDSGSLRRQYVETSAPPGFNLQSSNTGDWSELSGKLGLNYSLFEEVMLYSSYSRGYKAGGFDGSTLTNKFDPEVVDAYEVGMKSRWMDSKLRVNVSVFFYDYKDKQDQQRVFASDGTTPTKITNAASATLTGIEIEASARLLERLILEVSFGYLDAEFAEFDSLDGRFSNSEIEDLSGNKLPYSPEMKVHFGAEYSWSLTNGSNLNLRADYSWVDDQWGNAFNRDSALLVANGDFVPSYNQTNAHLRWESPSARWMVILYLQNLTDKEIIGSAAAVTTVSTDVGYFPPRTYGLKMQYEF